MASALGLPAPALLLTGAEWEALPEKLRDPYFQRLHENNLEALDRLAREHAPGDPTDVPWYLGTPQPRADFPCRVLKNRIQRATVAWYLTRDERHLAFAKETLELAFRSHDWRPVNGDFLRGANLHTGDLLYTVAFALDALDPYLDAELKARCVAVLRDTGLDAYLKGLERHDWWERCNFNWGSALHGNAGFAALALRHAEPGLSARVVAEARDRLRHVIDNFPEGGGWTEGMMYLGTTVGHLTDFVVALQRLTGDDLGLLANERFHAAIESWSVFEGGDRRPINFSNINDDTTEWGLPHVFWWARLKNRPEWAGFQEQAHIHRKWEDTHGVFFDTEAFWFREAHQPSVPPKRGGLRHYRGIDWAVYHGPQTWFALRGGWNGGNHNQKDLGQFILGRGTERFLCDPGYGMGATSQHNMFTVRGQEGCDAATAPLKDIQAFDGGFRITCDLQAAFPHATERALRHLVLLNDTHLLVLDDLRGRGTLRAGARWHLQTRLPWRMDGERLLLEGRTATLAVHRFTDAAPVQAKEWDFRGPIRTLNWRHLYDRVHAIHPMLLTFGAPRVASAWHDDTFSLEVNGQRVRYEIATARLSVEG